MGPAKRQMKPEEHDASSPDSETILRQMHLGMQLFRANSLSLTHLQFALRHGDRRSVLESVDRLHELDCRIGRLLGELPEPGGDDPEFAEISRQIEQQRVAVSFEKLALVSQVRGPDMVTLSHPVDGAPPDDPAPAPASDHAPLPATGRRLPVFGVLVLGLVTLLLLLGPLYFALAS